MQSTVFSQPSPGGAPYRVDLNHDLPAPPQASYSAESPYRQQSTYSAEPSFRQQSTYSAEPPYRQQSTSDHASDRTYASHSNTPSGSVDLTPGYHHNEKTPQFGDMPTATLGPSAPYNMRAPSGIQEQGLKRVGTLARRIHGWSWQAFPIGMGTGAVYVTMSGLQSRTRTMIVAETIFFFLNMALFILNVSTLALQGILYPRQAKRLLTDPTKNIFVPLVVLSFATLIIGTINYAVLPGHLPAEMVYVLFWIYVGFSVILSFPLLMVWFWKPHDIKTFTPAWAFLIFPMMLTGVVSFNVLRTMNPADPRSIGVLFVGYFFQGIGFFVTMFYICIYFLRIMMTGFMDGHQANGAFVACGPPGFTALALIRLGQRARTILPTHNLVSESAGEIWFASSVVTALMLFGLAIFLVVFGAMPYWFKLHKHLNEILGCWALTFPNVGWISSIGALGEVLSIPAFFEVQVIFVIMIGFIWMILIALTIVAFKRGLILCAKDEVVIQDLEAEKQRRHDMV